MSGGPPTTSSRSRTPFALATLDLAFRQGTPGTSARCVFLQDDLVPLDRAARRVLSAVRPSGDATVLPLGRLGDTAVSAVLLGTDEGPPGNLEPAGLRELFGMVGDMELGWASRAAQLAAFDRDHRFCGRCRRPAAASAIEHAVEREQAEECGVAATDLRYAGSQPWPFPHSLMLGFTATYAGGEIRADGVDVEAAGWFEADALPPLPAPGSIARPLIDDFADRVSTRAARRPGSA